jgi:hypothetical protein
MYVRGENEIDLTLLRRIADDGGLETDNGRYPAPASALMRAGYIKECAVGAGGYVCWKITQRGLDALT